MIGSIYSKSIYRASLMVLCYMFFCILQNVTFNYNMAMAREELPELQATDPAYFVRELVKGCSNIIILNEGGDYTKPLGIFLNENMNYKAVGSFLLGRHWHDLDEQKREQITNAIGPFIVNRYLHYLEGLLTSQYKVNIIDSVYRDNLQDYLVRTSVVVSQDHSKNFYISWRIFLHPETKTYKVSDIIVHRVSLLLTIRTLLNDYINKYGFDKMLDFVINNKNPSAKIDKK